MVVGHRSLVYRDTVKNIRNSLYCTYICVKNIPGGLVDSNLIRFITIVEVIDIVVAVAVMVVDKIDKTSVMSLV